jgi:DNA-binding MarR family transcriptional regulator
VGLSTAQLFILQGLAEEPSLSINDLARKTLTHQSSVSVVVSRLVEAGLLERRPSPTDARQSLISVTQAGKKVLKNAPETAQERLVKGLKKLPQDKRKQLAEHLEELMTIVGLQNEPAPLFFEEDKKKSKKRKPA